MTGRDTPLGETSDQWYERERAAFIAWWESEGQKKFSETTTLAAGAGWLARAEAASSEKKPKREKCCGSRITSAHGIPCDDCPGLTFTSGVAPFTGNAASMAAMYPAPSSAIGAPVATVINNNQPGWTAIVETAPNVTLDVGAKLHLATTRNTVIDECIAALDSRGLASVYADGTNTARTILCALKAT